MMKKIINTSKAPSAIGPYSQAVEKNGMLFVSGQIPLNPETGEIDGDSIVPQTERVLKNISNILKDAGFDNDDVVKTTCYLTELINFPEMNEVYARYFKNAPPARATVEVNRLPKDVLVEIEAIAVKG